MGWHVPDSSEYAFLVSSYDGEWIAGGGFIKLNEIGTFWTSTEIDAPIAKRFSVFNNNTWAELLSVHKTWGFFWSSSCDSGNDAYYHGLIYNYSQIYHSVDINNYGLSVRCIKNK